MGLTSLMDIRIVPMFMSASSYDAYIYIHIENTLPIDLEFA